MGVSLYISNITQIPIDSNNWIDTVATVATITTVVTVAIVATITTVATVATPSDRYH